MTPGFFTSPPSSFSVPHGRVDVRWILVAHLAITRAFEMIRQEGWPMGQQLENDVTIKLENVLNNKVLNRNEVDGFDKTFFGKVRRVEVVNFDGTRKSKKPDLCFDLQRETRVDWDQLQDALFAECKPVDKKHPLSGHYCAVGKDCTGIERFVIGDYAWAMEQALMIGYVRDGFSVHPHLADALGNETRKAKLGLPTAIQAIKTTTSADIETVIYHTTHQRDFRWHDGRLATPIILYHSWHDCR